MTNVLARHVVTGFNYTLFPHSDSVTSSTYVYVARSFGRLKGGYSQAQTVSKLATIRGFEPSTLLPSAAL